MALDVVCPDFRVNRFEVELAHFGLQRPGSGTDVSLLLPHQFATALAMTMKPKRHPALEELSFLVI